MKVLIADYGLNCWYGNIFDYEDRFSLIKELGYDGFERLHAKTEAEVINTSAIARKYGMDFATCEGGTASESILWSAALGKKYVWTDSNAGNTEAFYRQVNVQCESAKKFGVKVGLHNHLGTMVETWDQLTDYMKNCPDSGLILDTAHLAGAGGDPLRAVDEYFDRIVMVHLKDFVYLNKESEAWWERLRFCELGAGEMGDLNLRVLNKLIEKGYNGWLAVEHDTHIRDPKIDLKVSRDYIRQAGI